MHQAYKYSKAMLAINDPNYHIFFGNVKFYLSKINLSPEIYQLGIEAYNT